MRLAQGRLHLAPKPQHRQSPGRHERLWSRADGRNDRQQRAGLLKHGRLRQGPGVATGRPEPERHWWIALGGSSTVTQEEKKAIFLSQMPGLSRTAISRIVLTRGIFPAGWFSQMQ
jgi:hypothetical protein